MNLIFRDLLGQNDSQPNKIDYLCLYSSKHLTMSKSNELLPFLVSIPMYFVIHGIGRTNPLKIIGHNYGISIFEHKYPYIFSLWHNRVMLPLYYYRNTDITVIVSRSQDGEYITQAMKRFGFHATRGSTTRHGAEGLLGLVHTLKQNRCVVITPDGPKGPREKVKPGIIHLAKITGVPIIPACFSCSRHTRLNSWDRFIVPLPFGTSYLVTGRPILVPHDIDQPGIEGKRKDLQDEMDRITHLADRFAEGGHASLPNQANHDFS